MIGRLVPRPLPSSNVTAAALFRVVEAVHPVLLVDEADTFLGQREELRGIINSGHTRDAAFVLRVVGDGSNAEVRKFKTWGPKVLAGIGKLPETIADRAVLVALERKTPADSVEPLAADDARYDDLARQLARWAADNPGAAAGSRTTPSVLNDRAADNWRPLLSIADQLGGLWPEWGRVAATTLSGDCEEDDAAPQVLLLADLRERFGDADKLPTTVILEALWAREDRVWAEWRRGKPLSPQGLSRLLRPFGIRPRTIKLPDGDTAKGYVREEFEGAWSRYLPPVTPSACVTPSLPGRKAENGASASVTGLAVGDGYGGTVLALEAEGYEVTDPPPEAAA